MDHRRGIRDQGSGLRNTQHAIHALSSIVHHPSSNTLPLARRGVAEDRARAVPWGRPAYRVHQHAAHLRVKVGRKRLVAGAEIENLAPPAGITATAAKDLAAGEP